MPPMQWDKANTQRHWRNPRAYALHKLHPRVMSKYLVTSRRLFTREADGTAQVIQVVYVYSGGREVPQPILVAQWEDGGRIYIYRFNHD